MKRLWNLTLHPQGKREYDIAMAKGFELSRQPEGVEFGAGADELNKAAETLAGRLAHCAAAGEAALIGGHTAVWVAALDKLAHRGLSRPPLYYFSTLRKRDEHGRFVFEPCGLELLP